MTATFDATASRVRPSVLSAVFVLVFIAGYVGIELTQYTGRIASIWVGNAILLSFLLRHPRADWLKLLAAGYAANFAVDLLVGDPLLQANALTLSNIVETVIVAWPLRAWKLDARFTRPRSLLAFYALAGGLAPTAAALLSAAYFHAAQGGEFWPNVARWYASDALGLVILTPLLVTVRFQAFRAMFARDQIVVTLELLGVVAAAVVANLVLRSYPIAFLFFPAVVLLTFQRGFAGGAIGLAVAAAYLMIPVLHGQSTGGLRTLSVREQVIVVQVFVAVIGFSITLVGAALEERRRLERGLAQAIERAESAREEALVARDAAEKASRSKSMFLANMSHELRTPLNAVIGFTELMQAETYGPLGDPHYREYADLIRGAGCHLLDLINDILDMSKIEAGKLELEREPIATAALVGDCLALMSERARHGGIALSADLATAPIRFTADRRAMKQILLNLLSNAIKFTPPGGSVTLRARTTGTRFIISVVDTGVGIPSDQLYRLGNPFVQLRGNAGASQTGTGLGLALVRALAELHRGAMRIESVEGAGTTVSVELPLSEAASLAA
jgi:signal transduction histidine kinase